MELKQLEVFIAVVENNSFSEAAKKLYLTQPTISTHISSLEKELGTKLINRTTKQMQITADGYQLYDHALKLIRERENLLNAFREEKKKSLNIGASSIASVYILPEVLGAFYKNNEGYTIHAQHLNNYQIYEQVMNEQLDFGIVPCLSKNRQLCFVPILEDELLVATPYNAHFLELKKNGASLKALIKEPFILREKNINAHKDNDLVLAGNHISVDKLNVVLKSNDIELIKNCIKSELGISLITSVAIQKELKEKSLLSFPLDVASKDRFFYIVYKKEANLPQYVWQFIQFIQDYYKV